MVLVVITAFFVEKSLFIMDLGYLIWSSKLKVPNLGNEEASALVCRLRCFNSVPQARVIINA